MSDYVSDQDQSKRRGQQLDKTLFEVLADHGWKEVESRLCRGSTILGEARIPYVGSHYDLKYKGANVRLLVLGIDWYEAEFVSRKKHSEWILGCGSRLSKNHWRATQNLVWAFFNDFLPPAGNESWKMRVDGENVNWMRCFSFANLRIRARVLRNKAKPSEATTVSRSWTKSTWWPLGEMALLRTIDALDPTHIVIQQLNWKEYLADVIDTDCRILEFPHPSQRGARNWTSWSSNYFLKDVLPVLRVEGPLGFDSG